MKQERKKKKKRKKDWSLSTQEEKGRRRGKGESFVLLFVCLNWVLLTHCQGLFSGLSFSFILWFSILFQTIQIDSFDRHVIWLSALNYQTKKKKALFLSLYFSILFVKFLGIFNGALIIIRLCFREKKRSFFSLCSSQKEILI